MEKGGDFFSLVDSKSYPISWYDTKIQDDPMTIYRKDELMTIDGIDRKITFSVKLNPTDQRALRLIVMVQDQNDVRLLFNKEPNWYYDQDIMKRLAIFMTDVSAKMSKVGFVVQQNLAGNNSQSTKDGKFVIGEKEPWAPHYHLICRQVSRFKFGKNYQYVGPKPGELFDMRKDKIKFSKEKQTKIVEDLKKSFFLNKKL